MRAALYGFPRMTNVIQSRNVEPLDERVLLRVVGRARGAIGRAMRRDVYAHRLRGFDLTAYWQPGEPSYKLIADLEASVLLSVGDLLAREGHRVRMCRRAKCGMTFVAVKRQLYCTARCADLDRVHRFRKRRAASKKRS